MADGQSAIAMAVNGSGSGVTINGLGRRLSVREVDGLHVLVDERGEQVGKGVRGPGGAGAVPNTHASSATHTRR